ncbi:LysR family transcriptional regulator [Streptomyces sp. NPDC057539]|uniref:LysR family transcriptional regulator n=1 Tax=Streptomyces sp. NPDC057539 TaxID=3346159 RepID=UPI0036B766BE
MNDLETRQLRYFVAVAEELHFARAAERLGMAQPPLSRAIRQLERRLGVPLLRRTTRQVALTPAGQTLLHDARTALDAVSAAGRRAQRAGAATPRLRLALKPDLDGGLLPRILDLYAEDPAALPVELLLGRYGEQAQMVRDGRADVALLLSPFDDRGLDAEPLISEPFLLAVAARDPLAARSGLRLADLAHRGLPGGSPADQGVDYDAHSLTAFHEDTTFQDRFGSDTGRDPGPSAGGHSDLPEILRLVELSGMVCFLPASVARRYPRPEIAYLPVHDVEPATIAVSWPRDSHSPSVAAFVRTAVLAASPSGPEHTDPEHTGPEHPDGDELHASARRGAWLGGHPQRVPGGDQR